MSLICCPIGSGSLASNVELMFSLRSIERYGFGFDGVLLVGAVPSFAKGVESVVCDDDSSRFVLREGNIRGKLARGLAIADSIIAWNDDYYLVKPTDLGNIPYYFRENDMQETIDRKKGGWKTMQNTREYLLNKGFDVKMYDLHCPIIYKKAEFERVSQLLSQAGEQQKTDTIAEAQVQGKQVESNAMLASKNATNVTTMAKAMIMKGAPQEEVAEFVRGAAEGGAPQQQSAHQ